MAVLVAKVQHEVEQKLTMFHLMVKTASNKMEVKSFNLIPGGVNQIDEFNCHLFKAAAFRDKGADINSTIFLKNQIIYELADEWQKKQEINLEVRFSKLFDTLSKKNAETKEPIKPALILN